MRRQAALHYGHCRANLLLFLFTVHPSSTDLPAMPKVLIAPATLAGLQGKWLDLLREGGFEYVFPPKQHQLSEDELMDQLKGIDAAISGSEPYTRRVISAHPQLK